MKGHFKPWIAYKGCFHDENLCWSPTKKQFTTTTSCHILNNNTVGNCYFECKAKNYTNGGCANKVQFFFGLKRTICLCMCNYNLMQTLLESTKCNFVCRGSINNGVCGGYTGNYFSVYESTTVVLPDTHFGGFCLTCQPQSNSNYTILYSQDCNANATGYCITRYKLLSLQPWKSTFDIYWRYCKNNNLYIVSDTIQICHHRESSIWTGLRKYKIDNSHTDNDSCYIIEIQNGTANYNKRKCTEHHFFLCKQEIGLKQFPGMEYYKSTKNTETPPLFGETLPTTKKPPSYGPYSPVSFPATFLKTPIIEYTGHIISTSTTKPTPSKSEVNTTAVVGASIAGVVALVSAALFIKCMLKRRKLQCLQSNQQQAKSDAVFHNTSYDDLAITNKKQKKQDVKHATTTLENDNQGSIDNIDDIYVENQEEYDHLHRSRQKKMTIQTDDDRYGSASYLEDDSYSTLRQNKTVDSDFDNEYSVNSMPYSENQSSSVNGPEFDYYYQADQRKDW